MSRPRSIVVLGLMTQMPVAGVVWQTLHYLLGFEQLGYRAHYVEAHARTPSMLMTSPGDDGSARAAAFIAAVMRRAGFADRWAFHALHSDGRLYGMTERELAALYSSADLLINLHGGTLPREPLTATGRLVYVETDPVQPQVEVAQGLRSTIEMLDAHCAHFTFAENYGAPDCGLPALGRYALQPTRQPVVCELWETADPPRRSHFTTIGNWHQRWRDVDFGGERYGWSKDEEFARVLGLPGRVGPRLELALASYTEADAARLQSHGWAVTPALAFSTDAERYRSYVRDSYGEFTVAKDQNVRLRTGWFSDRSATYLAAGRPVITQDTGFGAALPTGAGLFAFATEDDAAAAIAAVDADPVGHRGAALAIAREHFAAPIVLGEMLDRLGERPPGGHPGRAGDPYPAQMRLEPVSRRPLVLPPATLAAVAAGPTGHRTASVEPQAAPEVSIVVVTAGGLPFTQMCLETVLANGGAPAFEVIVVDNGSEDGTRDYLRALATRDARVHVVLNDGNCGFPRACNQGLALARGEVLVLLNNDTMVAPGWLRRLVAPLADPAVGLVGPVTNRIGNEAEVSTGYATWGGFVREARQRAITHAGRTAEIGTVTMFCLAMRRDTFAALGPLDAGYGVGLLEDDDYAMRAREAGLTQLCVEDVLVHHHGEASFGALYPSGERTRVLARNRERFEQRWGVEWRPYDRRPEDAYETLVARVRELLGTLPEGATVLVVSKGEDRLVALDGPAGWHFPRADSGEWGGYHPAGSAEAISALDRLQASGATHIAFPSFSMWWLDHYADLAVRLRDRAAVIDDPDCVVFALAGVPAVAAESR